MQKHAIAFALVFALLGCTHASPVNARAQDPAAQAASAPQQAQSQSEEKSGLDVRLPLEAGSVRFAVIGDNGTGERPQYEIGALMERYRQVVKFDFTIMLGDNIYGGHSPQDFVNKFELPYKPLLDAGVKFYASLGNHDDAHDELLYKPFNMGGQHYYTFNKGPVQFFVLDSNYMDPAQLNWLTQELEKSKAKWKIAYFHHPLYSDARRHGPDVDLRDQLMPLFERYGMDLVFYGHEHVYERIKPVHGIHFFMLGSSGQLRRGNLKQAPDMAAGFDTDQTFMMVEIAGDKMYFQVISRAGTTVDSGTVERDTSHSPGG